VVEKSGMGMVRSEMASSQAPVEFHYRRLSVNGLNGF